MAYRITTAVILFLIFHTLFSSSVLPSFTGNNNGRKNPPEVEQDDDHPALSPPPPPTAAVNNDPRPTTTIDTAKSLFYPLSTTRFALLREAASNSWTWIKLKMHLFLLFKKSPDYPTSAPSLDFRRQDNGQEEAKADAAKEKVKEVVLKSLDQGTVVIENTARSAAKLAGDVMDTTAKKLQKTLSKQSEAEL